MTGHSELAITPRDRFLEAAKRELAAFEKKEREFRNKVRKERAEELRIPAEPTTVNFGTRAVRNKPVRMEAYFSSSSPPRVDQEV
jgi:hypothetical protein